MRLALLLLLCLPVCLYSREPPKASGNGAEDNQGNYTVVEKAKQDERGTDQAPLIIKKSAEDNAQAAHEREEDGREKAKADLWAVAIGIVTIVIGFFTVIILAVQAFYFGRQAERLKETIGAMKDIAEEQRADVDRNLAIAQDSADVARETLVADKRPWLLITRADVAADTRRDGGMLRFDVAVKNVGNSPATSISAECKYLTTEGNPDDAAIEAAIKELKDNRQRGKGILLVPTDSLTLKHDSCPSPEFSKANPIYDNAYILCCVFYSFTFKAVKSEGYYVAGYRFHDVKPGKRAVNIAGKFVRVYSHAD
jgi:hypothetical protein